MSSNTSFLRLGIDASAGKRGAAEFNASLDSIKAKSRDVVTGLKGLVGGIFSLQGAIAGAGLSFFIRDVVHANITLQGIHYSLVAATGSAEGAGRAFAFVRSEAARLGLDLASSAQQFAQIAVAARASGVSANTAKAIFTGVSEAATVLHLTSEQTAGALNAIQQMFSKGSVQAQELKLQLGNALPGAFGLAATAMGKTTQQLDKMLETGGVLASDLVPKLAKELSKLYGADAAKVGETGALAVINRFKTLLFDLKNQIAESGLMDGLLKGMQQVSRALQEPGVRDGIRQFGEVLGRGLKLAGDGALWLSQNLGTVKLALAGLVAYRIGDALKLGKLLSDTSMLGDALKAVQAGYGKLVALNMAHGFADLATSAAAAVTPLTAVAAALALIALGIARYTDKINAEHAAMLDEVATGQRVKKFYDEAADGAKRWSEEELAAGKALADNMHTRLIAAQAEEQALQKRIDAARDAESKATILPSGRMSAAGPTPDDLVALEDAKGKVGELKRQTADMDLALKNANKSLRENADGAGAAAQATDDLAKKQAAAREAIAQQVEQLERQTASLSRMADAQAAGADAVARQEIQERKIAAVLAASDEAKKGGIRLSAETIQAIEREIQKQADLQGAINATTAARERAAREQASQNNIGDTNAVIQAFINGDSLAKIQELKDSIAAFRQAQAEGYAVVGDEFAQRVDQIKEEMVASRSLAKLEEERSKNNQAGLEREKARLAEVEKAQQEFAHTMEGIGDNFWRGMHDAFTSFIVDLGNKGLSSFRDFFDSFKQLALKAIAEVVTAYVQQWLAGLAVVKGAQAVSGSTGGATTAGSGGFSGYAGSAFSAYSAYNGATGSTAGTGAFSGFFSGTASSGAYAAVWLAVAMVVAKAVLTSGTPKGLTDLTQIGNRLAPQLAAATGYNTNAQKAANLMGTAIANRFNGFLDSIDASLINAAKLQVGRLGQGKGAVHYVDYTNAAGQFVRQKFADINEAIDFATVQEIKASNLAVVSPEIAQAIKASRAQTMQELQSDVDFAKWVRDLPLGQTGADLRKSTEDYAAAMTRAEQLGLDTTNITAAMQSKILADRNALLGIQQSPEDQLRLRVKQYNDTVALMRSESEAKRAQLLADKASLQAKIALAKADITVQKGEFDSRKAFLEADLEVTKASADVLKVLLESLKAIDAAIAAVEQTLAAIPDLISDADLQDALKRLNTGKGGGKSNQDQVRDFLKERQRAAMGDVSRSIADLNDKYAEQIKLAGKNKALIDQLNAAKKEELALLAQQIREQYIKPYLGKPGSAGRSQFSGQLDGIMKDFDDLRKNARALHIPLWQINAAEKERLRLLGLEAQASLGIESAQTQLSMENMASTLAFLRANMDKLGISTERMGQIAAEVDTKLFLDMAGKMAGWLGDEKLTAELRQIQYDLDKANLKLQIESAYSLGLITQATHDRLLELFGKLPDDLPDSAKEVATHWQQTKDAADAAAESAGKLFRDALMDLRKFQQSLKLGDLSPLAPKAKLDEARAQYEAALYKAQHSTNPDDVKAYQEQAQKALEIYKGFYGSGLEYQQFFAQVNADINTLTASLPQQQDQAAQIAASWQQTATFANQAADAVTRAAGALLPNGDGLKRHALGGISNGPAIFGEAGPEAAVPLPDGRTIPVTIKTTPREAAPKNNVADFATAAEVRALRKVAERSQAELEDMNAFFRRQGVTITRK